MTVPASTTTSDGDCLPAITGPVGLLCSIESRVSSMLLRALFTACLLLGLVACPAACQDWNSLIVKADSLFNEQNYDSAAVFGRAAVALAEKSRGLQDSVVARLLTRVGLFYLGDARTIRRRDHDRAKAEASLKRSLEIREKLFGREHLEVAASLFQLGLFYNAAWPHALGEQCLRDALAIRLRLLEPNDKLIADNYFYLALVCGNQNKLDQEQSYYDKALQIRERILEPDDPDIARALMSLSNLYGKIGDHDKALQAGRRAYSIYLKHFGPEQIQVAKTINNLGSEYYEMGNFAQSERCFLEALTTKEKLLKPDNPDLCTTLLGLGDLYCALGRFTEAEKLYLRSLAIFQKEYGSEHVNVAAVWECLGKMYFARGNLADADTCFHTAVALREKIQGKGHPDVVENLIFSSGIASSRGDYLQSQKLLETARAICDSIYAGGHPLKARIQDDLGVLFTRTDRFPQAERALDSALSINKRIFGNDHISVARSLENNSNLKWRKHELPEAFQFRREACRIQISFLDRNASAMSERDALGLSNSMKKSASGLLSLYLEMKIPGRTATREAADIILASKGQVSDCIFQRQADGVTTSNSHDSALARSLVFTKRRLSRMYVDGPGDSVARYRSQVDSLSALAEKLEADLIAGSGSLQKARISHDVNTNAVASRLPAGAVLVEYIRFLRRNSEGINTPPYYAALILTRDNRPTIIGLGQAGAIDASVEDYRRHMMLLSATSVAPNQADMREYTAINDRLYSQLVQPLEKFTASCRMMLIAPDGELNLISFAGLMDVNRKFLIEKSSIQYLSAGRDVLRFRDNRRPGNGLFALGDPDFDSATNSSGNSSHSVNQPKSRPVVSPPADSQFKRNPANALVGRLPGTRREIEAVVASWRNSSSEPTAVYLGPEASEDNLIRLAPGHRVIHLATHGYYSGEEPSRTSTTPPGSGSQADWVGENPLLHSGLFLAGSNSAKASSDSLGAEDGILTAYEVSAMNLQGTELVVLSACETGIGDVQIGEGVYGLRRAFQLAGARTVVSTLWPLPDQSTSCPISQIYSAANSPISETLRDIQLAKIADLRKKGKTDHPWSWATFTVLGDWK